MEEDILSFSLKLSLKYPNEEIYGIAWVNKNISTYHFESIQMSG